MNTNQRNEANNQTDNGGNEKSLSSSRSGVEPDRQQAQATQTGNQQQGGSQQDRQPQGNQQGGSGSGRMGTNETLDDDATEPFTANRQSIEANRDKQAEQSNVGRRDDGTPD
ncbi:MAG: hypothetical protein ACJ8GW_05970 [Massilia sp.]